MMLLRNGTHPKQIGSNGINIIAVPITPYNGRDLHVENVTVGLMNCKSICNKTDERSDVKDMELDVLSLQRLG